MSAPWGDGKPSRGFLYCSECSGEGVVYNNADPTSGQWVRCECAELLETNAALLEIAKWVAAGHASCSDIVTKAQKAIAQAERK